MTEKLIQSQERPLNDAQQRRHFALTVATLAQQFYQCVLVDNHGTLPAISNSIFKSVPELDFITGGDLALTQGLNGRIQNSGALDKTPILANLVDRINALSPDQVRSGQTALDDLIDIAGVVSFSMAQRLKPHLPISLPETREGLKVLKLISDNVREQIAPLSDKDRLAENLSLLEQILQLLEEELIDRLMSDPQTSAEILEIARSQARVQLFEAKRREDEKQIEGLKCEIVQRKIAQLRDRKVTQIIDGEEREFSELDDQLYRIIEQDRLADRIAEASEQLSQKIEERKTGVINSIVRRRTLRKIAGLMLSNQDLRRMAAKISNLAEEGILALKDDEGVKVRSRIASQLIDMPRRKLLRLGLTALPNFEAIFEEERERLARALASGDPFLFIAQLSKEEFEIIRTSIPNIFRRRMSAENRALFALAKEQLQKRLAAESTEDELIEIMAEKLFRTFIRKLSQEMVNQAVQSLDIGPQRLLEDPYNILFDFSKEIIAAAQNNIEPSNLQSLRAAIPVLVETDDQVEPLNLPRFSQIITQLPRSEKLEQFFGRSEHKRLGSIVLRDDISSSDGPFQYFPDYKTRYPEVVIQALAELYTEYNSAFGPLVEANTEWSTDYQYCLTGHGREPVNYFVQIDMVGLPDDYLRRASTLEIGQIREDLRGRIFEIENSLAMYQLLMKNFSRDGQPSHFEQRFRQSLEALRRFHNKPIALLAVTKEKYRLMKGSEFGNLDDDPLTDEEVLKMSGFDKFFGPDEFLDYLRENGGRCDYLLYVRSSEPVAKLRNPNLVVEQPLLSNSDLRRIIKANVITFNVDSPEWPLGSQRRINDTKAYLLPMGMAYPIFTIRDFKSPQLVDFLKSRGVDSALIESGQAVVRAKPMQCSYGCYGHLRGKLNDVEFRQRLNRELRRRGPYVIQPEINNAMIINESDGQEDVYIDRNFFSFIGGVPRFLGGERTFMPINSREVSRGRIHGNESTVTAEIF